ncbi:hypothetical protein C8Q78DRAFT_315889 [Trametes maxima]|nr:hypothetical protein C8Q78DRAFT_315889 [Trametes maxima]
MCDTPKCVRYLYFYLLCAGAQASASRSGRGADMRRCPFVLSRTCTFVYWYPLTSPSLLLPLFLPLPIPDAPWFRSVSCRLLGCMITRTYSLLSPLRCPCFLALCLVLRAPFLVFFSSCTISHLSPPIPSSRISSHLQSASHPRIPPRPDTRTHALSHLPPLSYHTIPPALTPPSAPTHAVDDTAQDTPAPPLVLFGPPCARALVSLATHRCTKFPTFFTHLFLSWIVLVITHAHTSPL